MQRPIRNGRRRGMMMFGVVILLPVLFILAALTINVAYLHLVRTELQIAADTAGRAAGRTFTVTGDRSLALAAAQAVAARNTVGGRAASVEAGDLEFGIAVRSSRSGRYEFTVSEDANAVRLTTRSFAEQDGGAFKPAVPIFGAAMKVHPVCSAVSIPHNAIIPLAAPDP